jgi:hypothetical protein
LVSPHLNAAGNHSPGQVLIDRPVGIPHKRSFYRYRLPSLPMYHFISPQREAYRILLVLH